ncbi:MAG TPA: sigma-54 dependent transcriptional regulator, partial [Byssovorax sp.]
AQALINVLVLGETGVGKEVLARTVHERSGRSTKPFLSINCAAISESLLEAELFGHEKGAFTGAAHAHPGLFESVDGGTLFLDEIGELPAATQVKLLRVLEERKVLRVGGRTPRAIDVRFIAATHRDLDADSETGRFRQDLLFRLNAFTLFIPPLRERRDEIGPLAAVFAATVAKQLDRPAPPSIAPETLRLLEAYPFPGNVRELKNVIERAVVLANGPTLLPEHLPPKVVRERDQGAPAPASLSRGSSPPPEPSHRAEPPPPAASNPGSDSAPGSGDRFQAEIRTLERQRIVDALDQCAGNQTRAAEVLGVSRRTLSTWLERHKIPRPRKREDG